MSISKRVIAAVSIVAMSTQVFLVPLATAAEFQTTLDEKPRIMLRASLPFGGHRSSVSAPNLALLFERSVYSKNSDFTYGGVVGSYQTLAEFRLTKDFGYGFRVAGMPIYDSRSGFSGDESGSSTLGSSAGLTPLRVALIALVGVAVLCAAEKLFCEDDDSGY
jgi:hypothetical protein